MKSIAFIVCACLLAFPTIAPAQEPDGMIELTPWWDRPVVKDLGLSQNQLRQVRAVVRDSRAQLVELRAAVRKAEMSLVEIMSEERVDMGKAQNAIDRVIFTRADLLRTVSHMSLKLRQVLTYPQWQELRKRNAERARIQAAKRQRNGAGSPP